MPWFPDFVAASELAHQDAQAAGTADPVAQYLRALEKGDVRSLESVWRGTVVIEDPRAGIVRGHHRLRRFVLDNQAWLADRHSTAETVASTRDGARAAVEVLASLDGEEGGRIAWPIAVVAEARSEESVLFRSYCSQWPVDGQQHERPPILGPSSSFPGGVIGDHLTALMAGKADDIVKTFAADGYFRGPLDGHDVHRGSAALQAYYRMCFSAGGGIELQACAVTDDGVRCVLEYNCLRWGQHALPPQAGLMVFERHPNGLLEAVRVYDDVEAPGDIVA